MFNFSAVLILVLCNSFSFIEQGSTTFSRKNDSNPLASAEGTTSATIASTSEIEIEEEFSTDQEKSEEIESDADNTSEIKFEYEPEGSIHTEGIYRPFILLRKSSIMNDELDLELPTRYSNDEKKEKLHLIAEETYDLDTLLCPEIETKDRNLRILMDNLDKMMPEAESCLFIADDGQENCKLEPRAKLQVNKRKVNEIEEESICGINNQQKLITTAFINCGTKENMRKYAQIKVEKRNEAPEYKMRSYPMYTTCYDFEHRQTLWTRHTVLTPALLAHENYPHQSLNTININDFSTSNHYTKLKPKTLDTLKEAYESTTSNKKKIHSLVPKDHMALPYWKKSTNHIINTAPLLRKFEPLMKVINEGIFKASAYALAEYGKTLEIYTKADTTTSISKIRRGLTRHLGVSEASPSFTSNIWYKFIHNEQDRSGILIVLHNTKGFVEDKICTDYETRCDFQTWTDDYRIQMEILTYYAYCCYVSQDQIKQLFSMNELQPVEKELELQKMIDSYSTVIKKLSHMGI